MNDVKLLDLHEKIYCVDKPAMFEIPPQMEHAVLNTSEKDIYVLSFSNSEDRETITCTSLFKPDNSID